MQRTYQNETCVPELRALIYKCDSREQCLSYRECVQTSVVVLLPHFYVTTTWPGVLV
jgi:hypothetical protein